MIDANITDYSQITDMTCTQYEQVVYRGHTRDGVTYIKGSGTYFWIDDDSGSVMEGSALHCQPSYWYGGSTGFNRK